MGLVKMIQIQVRTDLIGFRVGTSAQIHFPLVRWPNVSLYSYVE